ncbi:MAG TPA: stimulus-sensing domain-containing protein [Stellaceae bacterium]|jgi:two-component system sensor histidine kinase ChvG|nr:stimulus-sensing domain-containing protein [Stellaceae bacterium]
MALAIDTATVEPKAAPVEALQLEHPSAETALGEVERPRAPSGGERRRGFGGRVLSPLTRRIIAVNVLPLLLLAVGFLYLGKFESSLIGQEIESLRTQGEIFAAALGEGAVLESADEGEVLLPDLSRQMMRRLVEPTRTRARLFDIQGKLIADSRLLRGPGDSVQVAELPAPDTRGLVRRLPDRIYDWVVDLLPNHRRFPPYHEGSSAEDYREAMQALHGESASVVRSDPGAGGLVISVAVPVQRYKQVLGAVLLSTGSGEIEEELRTVRLELLRIFGVALLVTVLLSLYLAGTIGRPVRRLAAAAERARGRGARVEIPDFTGRGDEIGELSGSLREMTDTLWQRMSAIESFAADVAHEIKNPLSSLRSAVETAARIEDPEKQRRLMAIIFDDVERLDRLISDISDASRLDAELSRLELAPTDIGAMLRALVEVHQATRSEDSPRLSLDLSADSRLHPLIVPGIEGRLSQVFRNVIANAVSFSPSGGEIRIRARHDGRAVLVIVEDDGPGIPDDKLSTIFDRFYSERPVGEKFGTHSGLGLSISKQIIEAHRGRVWAENRRNANGEVAGARFLIRLAVA